jgi:hypothetical protein
VNPPTPSDRILGLVEEAYADLANDAVPLSDVVAKATRIARLRGDYDNLMWLEMEQRPIGEKLAKAAIGHEIGAHYTAEEAARLTEKVVEEYIAERTAEMPVDVGSGTGAAKTAERALPVPVRELEDRIRMLESAVDDSEIPSTMHNLDIHAAYDARKKERLVVVQAVAPIRQIMSRIEHRVHEFLSLTEKQLVFGQVNADIFERNREYVDAQLASVSPAALGQLTAAYRRADEGDDEARSQALLSCRRALKSVADALYPPTDEAAVGAQGEEHALTDDKWRNRLIEFAKGKLHDSPAGDLMQTQLDELDRRLRALNDASSRGVHADASAFELNQAVIQTYLTVGDLLRLHAGDSGSDAVEQGLARSGV